MIRSIVGKIVEKDENHLIVETYGLGYEVFVPQRYQVAIGQNVKFLTYHLIREQEQALFGFETQAELRIFNHLITVNSIGPKLAMSIMSAAQPTDIRTAVDQNNIGFFQSLPGVGKKSAAKIIVELKGKLSTGELVVPTAGSELTEALKGLGFTNSEIQPILQKLPIELTNTEAQVAWALKEFAG